MRPNVLCGSYSWWCNNSFILPLDHFRNSSSSSNKTSRFYFSTSLPLMLITIVQMWSFSTHQWAALLHRPTCSVGFCLNRCWVHHGTFPVGYCPLSSVSAWCSPDAAVIVLFFNHLIWSNLTCEQTKKKKNHVKTKMSFMSVFSSPLDVSEVRPGVSTGERCCEWVGQNINTAIFLWYFRLRYSNRY